MRPARWAAWLPVAAALAGLGAAGAWSIRTGWADYLFRRESVRGTEAAIALMPDQAEYYARLAWLVSDNDPRKAGDALRRAVALNPWDAQSWIELGLRAEADGDGPTARQCLLRAAEADAEFLPRWTLANYYFRHGDPAMFWRWAKESARMVYADARPLFLLCGRLEEDGKLIDRLRIRKPEVRAAYLDYLLSLKRLDLIGPAVHRLLEENLQESVPVLLEACDRLLDGGDVDQAAQVWNRLADAGKVPFRTPAGEGDQLVANGAFTVPPLSRGFDWRLPALEGIGASLDEPRGLRVTFSGRQPEDCEMLVQSVPVRRNMPYALTFEYRTRGIASGVGLVWRVTNANGGTVLKEGPSLSSEAGTAGQLSFETPPGCRLVRLALRYRRAAGTTRMEGYLVLRDVALKPLAHSPIEGARVRK